MVEFNKDEARNKLLQSNMDRIGRKIAEEASYIKHLELRLEIAKEKMLSLEHDLETLENDLFGDKTDG